MKLHTRKAGITWPALVLVVCLVILSQSGGTRTASAVAPKEELDVQAQASQGFAAPGNTQPANFLVIVTDRSGTPVTGLTQSDFQIIDHLTLPGQVCGFGSNNITFFEDKFTGAYQIQVSLNTSVPGCHWVAGDYLTQVTVLDGARRGQAATTLSVKCQQSCGAPAAAGQ